MGWLNVAMCLFGNFMVKTTLKLRLKLNLFRYNVVVTILKFVVVDEYLS